MAHLYLFSADICVTEPAEHAPRTRLLQRIQTKWSAKRAFFNWPKWDIENLFSLAGFPGFAVYTLPESPDVLSIK